MKAILIARVSTDDQAEALPAQIYKLQDYALKNELDYELFEIKKVPTRVTASNSTR